MGIDSIIIWLAFAAVVLAVFYLVAFWYGSTTAAISPDRVVGVVDENLWSTHAEGNGS